ncbi:MAG: type IVB secretion system protein IcmH/DotU [Pseudomonadales bacterium]
MEANYAHSEDYNSADNDGLLSDDKPQDKGAIDNFLFQGVKGVDVDEDFWFKLRGNSINLLIDVAEPLLGLVCRVKSLTQYEHIEELYQQVVDEIRMIDTELAAQGYEKAVMLSYRYVLCTFIDESIMGTRWGSGVWAQHSLLTRFHNETWGGEKVFSILSRIETDPKRYRELLEFIYLCLCLGFGGRYRVDPSPQNEEKFQQILADLQELLSLNSEELPDGPLAQPPTRNVLRTKHSLNRRIPLWSVFAAFGLGLAATFGYFYFSLAQRSEEVLDKLNHILN